MIVGGPVECACGCWFRLVSHVSLCAHSLRRSSGVAHAEVHLFLKQSRAEVNVIVLLRHASNAAAHAARAAYSVWTCAFAPRDSSGFSDLDRAPTEHLHNVKPLGEEPACTSPKPNVVFTLGFEAREGGRS